MLMNANRLAIVGASKNSTVNNATAKSARRGGIAWPACNPIAYFLLCFFSSSGVD
jgi:hypothetical protein